MTIPKDQAEECREFVMRIGAAVRRRLTRRMLGSSSTSYGAAPLQIFSELPNQADVPIALTIGKFDGFISAIGP